MLEEIEVTRNVAEGTQQLGNFALGIFALAMVMMLFVGAAFLQSSRRMSNKGNGENMHFQSKQLHFAAVILTGLGLIFILSMGMYYYSPNNTAAKTIFDACKTILPPIITLILGFYFGQENEKAKAAADNPKNEPEDNLGSEESNEIDTI